MKEAVTGILLAFFILQPSRACTAFCISEGGRSLLAKNLDWPVAEGLILVNRSGIQKTSFTLSGKALSWISLYSSITFNQFGKEFPLGGMNERGLVVEELNMPALNPLNDSCRQELNEFQVVQYMLDNFASVEEIEPGMKDFMLVPLLVSLHYLVMDREGQSLVVEFDGTAFSFYDPGQTGLPVLSNNPYRESLRYIRNFRGFGGDQAVVHRPGSNERFVSVAGMLLQDRGDAPLRFSFEILDIVSQADTRWSIVYDATNLVIHLKFHACRKVMKISLEQLLTMEERPTMGACVSNCFLEEPGSFRPIPAKENEELVRRVLGLLSHELDLDSRKEALEKFISYSTRHIIEK